MSPETAIKGHFTALALYVLFASNCAFGGYYYYKTLNVEDDDEDDRKNESEMDRCKCDHRIQRALFWISSLS